MYVTGSDKSVNAGPLGVLERAGRTLDIARGAPGKCRHLHGHNGRAVITLAASALDSLGMVMDFSHIKRIVGAWIDANLDHRMILHKDDPVLPTLKQQGEPVFVVDVNPTAENLAKIIFQYVKGQGFPVVQVTLWETDDSYAVYGE